MLTDKGIKRPRRLTRDCLHRIRDRRSVAIPQGCRKLHAYIHQPRRYACRHHLLPHGSERYIVVSDTPARNIRKLCSEVAVARMKLLKYEAGYPPGRRFQLAP